MKKIIIAFLGIGLFCLLINSCRKSDISGDSKGLILGAYITLDSSINQRLDFSNASATVSIKIGSKGSPVASVNIYVATGSSVLDTTKWALIKNVPYSDGVILSVSTAELAAALAPNAIAPGSQYVLQNEVVTKDGRKFSVSNTPSTYNSFPGYNMALTWSATAVCAFVQSESIGNYKVVRDDWGDFVNPTDIIVVSAGPDANSLSFLGYPAPEAGGTNRQPWILKVDPATGAVTMKTQYVGDYPGAPGSNASATGFVFSCSGGISLVVSITYGGSPYGGIKFILQKQ